MNVEFIHNLAGGLGARHKGDNEFKFDNPENMQTFILCIDELGLFPADDWFLMSVLVCSL